MITQNNTILITGGTFGIGMALAIRFLETGKEVIICGREEIKLLAMKTKYPQLFTF